MMTLIFSTIKIYNLHQHLSFPLCAWSFQLHCCTGVGKSTESIRAYMSVQALSTISENGKMKFMMGSTIRI